MYKPTNQEELERILAETLACDSIPKPENTGDYKFEMSLAMVMGCGEETYVE